MQYTLRYARHENILMPVTKLSGRDKRWLILQKFCEKAHSTDACRHRRPTVHVFIMYIWCLRNCFRFITPRSIVFRLLLVTQFSTIADVSHMKFQRGVCRTYIISSTTNIINVHFAFFGWCVTISEKHYLEVMHAQLSYRNCCNKKREFIMINNEEKR